MTTTQRTMVTGTLTSTGKRYGTHGSVLHTDETGKKFLVKYQDVFRSHLDVGISLLQARLGMVAPRVEIDDNGNAVHEWLEGSNAFLSADKFNFPAENLRAKAAERLTVEMAFDWLISNHDSHADQFVTTAAGLVGLDKGQAFKHLGKDELSPTYHPNAAYGEAEPVYHAMKRAGSFTVSKALLLLLDTVNGMSDAEYLSYFADYVRTCPFVQAEKFEALALARKHNLESEILTYVAA